MSLTTTIEKEILGPVWDKPVPDRWLCFCPTFLSFCWSSSVAFGEFTFQKLVTNQLFGLEFCAVQLDPFCLHQKVMNKLISTKNHVFISLVGPSNSGKTYLIQEWLKVTTFQPKFDKVLFFYQHLQPLYDVMQKKIAKLEFVQSVNFDFINSSKNNGTKFLLIFYDSCA